MSSQQQYPEDDEVVRNIYDIITRREEIYRTSRYDLIHEGIKNFIDLFIEDFVENHNMNSKYLKPYKIRILSFYYSDLRNNELYKIAQVLGNQNDNLKRLKLCEYIVDKIYNYI